MSIDLPALKQFTAEIGKTSSTKRTDDPELASFWKVSDEILVVRVPTNGSNAIPLEIILPHHSELITWSFANRSTEPTPDLECLLIVKHHLAGKLNSQTLFCIRTHFRDRHLRLADKPTSISFDEAFVLSNAVISVIGPRNAHRFGSILPIISPGLDAICAAGSDDFQLAPSNRADSIIVTGLNFIPTCMIARAPADYIYLDIAAIQVRAGKQAAMTLTMRTPPDICRLDKLILIGGGRHAAARVRETKLHDG